MAFGDREQILNIPNESINRADVNPDTLLRRIIPGSGMLLAGTGVGDETISVDNTYFTPTTRVVTAGTGLVGGGALSGDITLHVGAGTGIMLAADTVSVASPVVLAARTIAAGSYLSGGGDLSADRRFDFDHATFGTLLAGSFYTETEVDAFMALAASKSITLTAGTGLTGGGNLTTDRTLSVASPAVLWHGAAAAPYIDPGSDYALLRNGATVAVLTAASIFGGSLPEFRLGNTAAFAGSIDDYFYYSQGSDEWVFNFAHSAGLWLGDGSLAFAKSGADITTGIRMAGTPTELQFRDDDAGAWRSLADLVLNTRTLTAGSGLTGGGSLAADRTFHVGAGTGIITNINAVSVASPTVLWHANAATPSIMELHPTTAGTARLGYDVTSKRWYLGTAEAQDPLTVDAGTVVASASYGIRLAGPALRYFSFDEGWDCVAYNTIENAYAFLIGGATRMVLSATSLLTRLGTAGFTKDIVLNNVAASPVTVLSGVTAGFSYHGFVRASDGGVDWGYSGIKPGFTLSLYNDGSNVFVLAAASAGNVTVLRTSGSLTLDAVLRAAGF